MPWHPEEPEDAQVKLDLTAEYSAQSLADGRYVCEIFSPVKNAGGEEIPGLWRISGYNLDSTVYLSVIVKVMEKKDKPEKPSFGMLQRPATRKRKADYNDENDEPLSKKRSIYV